MAEETAVLETPAVESAPIASETASQPDISEQESRNTTTPKVDAPVDKIDARKNPDALRKALKFLRENGGEHSERAADLERMLGETKSYKTVYPTVREARETKLAVDAIGGLPKLAELQQSAAHMADVDARMESGDPSIVAEIFEQSPKGMAKLVPAILDKLGETDPQAYQSAMKPHAVSFMDSQGLVDAIDGMSAAFNAGKPEDARGIHAKIVNWYKGLAATAKPAADPARLQLEKDQETFAQQRFDTEGQKLNEQVLSHAEKELDKYLLRAKKEHGLSDEGYDLLRADAWEKLKKLRNADPIFKATYQTHYNAKGRKISPGAVKFYQDYNLAHAKDAADYVVRVRYPSKVASIAPAKDKPTSPPTGAAVVLDQQLMVRKLGRSEAMGQILSGRGLDKAGKPIVKSGNIWRYA